MQTKPNVVETKKEAKKTLYSENFSDFQKQRQEYHPRLPKVYTDGNLSYTVKTTPTKVNEDITRIFPALSNLGANYVEISQGDAKKEVLRSPLRIGVVLSGGQAAGGHNVIAGVFDFIKNYHTNSQLFGFKGGPHGIYTGNYVEIDADFMDDYRNQGGFDMICSGRHKIETEQQFDDSLKFCKSLKLDGLVVIGGDDSNTNACLLAEYFLKHGSGVKIIGVPKTIDGDLKNEWIEVSFGFDTATRVYSELIGNICLDTVSSKKYYHFIRVMGRSASHIALECALLTQINLVIIGEEVEAKNQTLHQIVTTVANMICERSVEGKNHGIILVPEGLVEFVPEINLLIKEINEICAKAVKENFSGDLSQLVSTNLTPNSLKLFNFLPLAIKEQLLLDRDPHGNVQVAKIDTERLLILLLQTELDARNSKGEYKGKFSPQSHYFGYEGRCALPSYFDTQYCYGLGYNAGNLVSIGLTGYMSVIRNLSDSNSDNWVAAGCQLSSMMNVERRKGKDVPVIKKALVELDGDMFKYYAQVRDTWMQNDAYISPGPIQFEGETRFSCPYLVKAPTNPDLSKFILKSATKDDPYSLKSETNLSALSRVLLNTPLRLPLAITNKNFKLKLSNCLPKLHSDVTQHAEKHLPELLSYPNNNLFAEILQEGEVGSLFEKEHVLDSPNQSSLRIGVVYCGRQAPGGNNIIDGLLEFQKALAEMGKTKVTLLGFNGGTVGLFNDNCIEITQEKFKLFRNHGGYDFLGRSVDAIRSSKDLESTKSVCEKENLDALVLIGASHTLTDATLLTNYFLSKSVKTSVIAIPATVDGNISHPLFEACVGFDTASKVYSQLIGNIMTDSASATKYWYLMRLMGNDPSHLVLECALQTHPNYVIISEECASKGQNLHDIVNEICEIIIARMNQKKNFGTILIPEGLLSHLQQFKSLIDDLNTVFEKNNTKEYGMQLLSEPELLKKSMASWSFALFSELPDFIQKQLLTERETGGKVHLSQIETERLLSFKIAQELQKRSVKGFASITHFFGYQGRCSFPSNFDATLATTYGFTAGVLALHRLTGYCVTARHLSGPMESWKCGALPLLAMSEIKEKSSVYGDKQLAVPSSEVTLSSKSFLELKKQRVNWVFQDHYCNPGPIQFENFGKYDLNKTLRFEHENNSKLIGEVEEYCERIKATCKFGSHEEILRAASSGLRSLNEIIEIMRGKY